MKPNISEFSYGYAVVDELIHWHGTPITAAPVFPSLYQEGQDGGGWDAKLQKGGIPLFIQFKLSDWMMAAHAKERQNGTFNGPYYRMFIRKRNHSRQHEMLLDLEQRGNEVYYVAPGFHQPNELNDAYINHSVKSRSIWVRPSAVGPLTDDDQHYVAFLLPNQKYYCSEPKTISKDTRFEGISEELHRMLKEEGSQRVQRDRLEQLANELKELGGKKSKTSDIELKTVSEGLAARHPIERAAYYAATYFDAQLMIIQESLEA